MYLKRRIGRHRKREREKERKMSINNCVGQFSFSTKRGLLVQWLVQYKETNNWIQPRVKHIRNAAMLQQQNFYVKTQQPSTWADTSLHLRLLKGSMTSLINNRNLLSKSVYNSKSLNLKVVVSLSPNK